jgi:hypothetical protein
MTAQIYLKVETEFGEMLEKKFIEDPGAQKH